VPGTTLVHSVRALDERGEAAEGWLLLEGDTIARTGVDGEAEPPADRRVDGRGRTAVPGFIDLHGHGGAGRAFDEGAEAIRTALALHRAHGTTRAVISLVTAPVSLLLDSLACVAEVAEGDQLVLGSHLEGPYLAAARRGAHDAALLREPDHGEVEEFLAAARGTLRQVTIAPELPGAGVAIERLAAAGVVPAVGHTMAGYAEACAAFDRGARILTHAFNGMTGLHHRAPGPVVAAIDDDRVTLELVLDGHHVADPVSRMLLGAAPGRVAMVTDAMAAAGAGDGAYRLGGQEVLVSDGVARLVDGDSIAGSTLTQDQALRHAITVLRIPSPLAVAALTVVPARALGIGDRLGLLAPGYAADLVLLDDDWRVTAVWAAGAPVGRER
jgi:N-acetylglucosamine-6-phosphate deacetylase